MGKIIIAGIGPGSKEDITPAVLQAVGEADVIVGYKYYFQFIEPYVREGCKCVDTGMKKERERAEQALRLAEEGKTVVVISSGDAGIYGMAPLIYEMQAAIVGEASKLCIVGEASKLHSPVVGEASKLCVGSEASKLHSPVVGEASKLCIVGEASKLHSPVVGEASKLCVVGEASKLCIGSEASKLHSPVVGESSKLCAVGEVSKLHSPVVGEASKLCSSPVGEASQLHSPVVGEDSKLCIGSEASKLRTIEIVTLPGISAFQKAASLLGAPIGHDLCLISLSDLMTPWEVIERRIKAAAVGDFVTAVYNPKSHERYWQLYRLQELFLNQRSADTPVGYVRQAGRPGQEVRVTTLGAFDPEEVDMFTVILIGNSQSYIVGHASQRDAAATVGHASQRDKEGAIIITPRGYYNEERGTLKIGQQIMIESFRTISSELSRKDYPSGHLWALLHAIHTTADFDMERILYTDENAVETLYHKVKTGTLKTIVTDVTMVASGIRKGALQRLGIEAKCYLSDPRVAELTAQPILNAQFSTLNCPLTRTQAGIRLAVEEHPDALFAFGNAPTALMELCDLIRKGKARPAGIIAAPVGFVHVRESKHMVKPFHDIPKIIVEGRKGGSNLAATLCNAILTFDDAAQLKPGRDL